MKQKKLPFGRAVRVKWYDSMSLGGWQYNTERIGDVAKIVTIGYVVSSTPQCLTLTSSIGSRGGALDPVSIPWKAVVELDVVGKEWDR